MQLHFCTKADADYAMIETHYVYTMFDKHRNCSHPKNSHTIIQVQRNNYTDNLQLFYISVVT